MSFRGVLLALPVVLLLVVAIVLGRAPERPGGPAGSSYATAPDGVAAWAELLRRAGYDVRRIREPLDERPPSPSETVVLLDGRLAGPEASALRRFVRRGGRVVLGGRASIAALDLRVPRGARPVRRVVGRGEALLVGDDRPLHNRALARGDHAATALELAGPPGRRVAFVESVHGYLPVRGLAALPGGVRRCLWLLGLAVLALLVARGRRFGPPEGLEREPAPPRRLHVDALAAALARTKDRRRVAWAPVREAARAAVVRRAALDPAAGDAAVRAAAQRLGLPDDEVRAIAGDGDREPDLLATGRALAHLMTTTTETT